MEAPEKLKPPEKIWILNWDTKNIEAGWLSAEEYPWDETAEDGDAEYIRADLCTMPGELVEAIKRWPCPSNCDNGAIPHGPLPDGSWEAEQCQFCDERSRVLAWHEGKG